jgi:hypothetical protein
LGRSYSYLRLLWRLDGGVGGVGHALALADEPVGVGGALAPHAAPNLTVLTHPLLWHLKFEISNSYLGLLWRLDGGVGGVGHALALVDEPVGVGGALAAHATAPTGGLADVLLVVTALPRGPPLSLLPPTANTGSRSCWIQLA